MIALPQYDLCLADGSCWIIAAGDEAVVPVVDQFARAMSLSEHASPGRFLWVFSDERSARTREGDQCHILEPAVGGGVSFGQLLGLSYGLVCRVLATGGVLLHGALAEYDPAATQKMESRQGVGVIMAASSGTGKTTASRRLRFPWTSLSDDLTLVVRGVDGNFWAHPWPTWSQFWDGGAGGVWNTPRAVPLSTIFIVARNEQDGVEEIGPGRSVSLLLEVARQAVHPKERRQKTDQFRTIRLMRFNNLCNMAKVVPVRILHFSAHGMFWVEMEKALQASVLREYCEYTQTI